MCVIPSGLREPDLEAHCVPGAIAQAPAQLPSHGAVRAQIPSQFEQQSFAGRDQRLGMAHFPRQIELGLEHCRRWHGRPQIRQLTIQAVELVQESRRQAPGQIGPRQAPTLADAAHPDAVQSFLFGAGQAQSRQRQATEMATEFVQIEHHTARRVARQQRRRQRRWPDRVLGAVTELFEPLAKSCEQAVQPLKETQTAAHFEQHAVGRHQADHRRHVHGP